MLNKNANWPLNVTANGFFFLYSSFLYTYAFLKSMAAKTVREGVPGYTDVILFLTGTCLACRSTPLPSLCIPLQGLDSVALVVTPSLKCSKYFCIPDAFLSLLCRFPGNVLQRASCNCSADLEVYLRICLNFILSGSQMLKNESMHGLEG